MVIFGQISAYKKALFRTRIGKYYTLDPSGQTWTAMIDILNHVADRAEFRHSFNFPEMVLMLREWAGEVGLVREDRGENPHVLEGYYGFLLIIAN